MKNRLLLLFLALFYIISASVATENYKFRTMSPDGGFYYDGVKAIEQDENGFIWVMMDYELYRFDGYHYKKYYPYFASMVPTKRWIFHNMASDSSGYLYVNTNNGLYRYDQISNCFERIFDMVSDVKVDEMDKVWVRCQNQWGILETDAGKLNIPEIDGKLPDYSNAAFCLHNKDVYTFIHRKVYRFNYAENSFVLCMTLPNIANGDIRFAQARMGKLWAFVDKGGLYKIDLSTFKVEEHYAPLPEYSAGTFRTFYIDKKENIWFGSIDGICVFNPLSKKIIQYRHSVTDPFSLPNNSVWKIYEDRQGNVWIGTYSGKLCYVDMEEGDAFRSYLAASSDLNYAPVSAFAEDDDYLWIGTEGGGVNRMDKRTGEFKLPMSGQGVMSNNIKSLLMDGKSNLWVSMFRGGIEVFNAGCRETAHYKNSRSEAGEMLVDNVRKTVLEGDSGLWVAYQYPAPKISYFSFKEKVFRHISLDSVGNYDYLFDILRQGERTLWAISNEALYRLDTQTEEVRKVQPDDSEYLGLFTFCLDDSGNIWIGTIGNGLIKFDTNTLEFIPMKDVLQREIYSIYSICYSDGRVWMGTDDGLCCYDTVSGQLMKFDKRENTQGQVYYPLAVLKGKDGKLYFGGTDGFTVVDPVRISYNRYKPRAVISEFFVNHEPVQPNYDVNGLLHTIALDYDESNFGFEFAADNYQIPEKNMFRYRLKGYNDSWITVDARQRTVMYSKVPAGNYSFEVCAANNDGVWGDPTVVRVVRRRAPWASVPAYICYVLALLAMTYLVFRHYAEKKRLRTLLYQENVEREKKEQIHQAQLRFFTNISHDFRTPLSLIMAALDKLRREGLKEYYYRILNGNVQRLLNLVNELMDFRTVENGMMKLELEPIDVNGFVKGIAGDFMDYAAERKIDFRIECDGTLPAEVYADKNVVEKIVMNLLNNAFKYTRDGGNITLLTKRGREFASQWTGHYKVGDCMEEAFSIVVSDTGVGISGESISSVFERFYKVNTVNADSHLGTGIGLALVKSLVLLQKGCVSIYSEREKGTDMVVCLPMDSSVFGESDFAGWKLGGTPEAGTLLPAADETSEGTKGAETGTVPPSARKLLIVEDNTDLRVLIAEALSDEFQVVQAGDGIEALKKMEDLEFDMVISDIMMPHKDGVSLCNDIKGNVNTSHIPVVLLTAKTSLESKIEGVDCGADLYFEKPIDLTYLKLSIQNVFKNRQQLKEHYAKNYYADSGELVTNEQDNRFLKKLVGFIDEHMDQSDMDVNLIAEELSMSRSKLYAKVKSLTGKSIVEFVLNYRLRKAAKLIIEENMTMKEVMLQVGIESQAYFTNSFKKVFGETPTSFANKHKKKG